MSDRTRTLLLLGASGDLTRRFLLPALGALQHVGKLPDDVRVRGVDRKDRGDEDFRDQVRESLREHAPDLPASVAEELARRCDHRTASSTDADAMREVVADLDTWTAYLALPPTVFPGAIEALQATDPPEDASVVVEKPFGTDRASAQELNELLARGFDESRVFRVDHFLAEQTVQNVLGLRFANRVFEPLWNSQHVASVDVVWDETLLLEGRASYYDQAGALQDMLQNHLMQILCLVGMEAPASLGARDLRDAKVQLLRAVRAVRPEEAARWTRRARYGASPDGRVRAYVDEEGVDPQRGTETYAEIVLHVDNWRWSGVPFRLRSGKGLDADRAYVEVSFREVPHLAFGQDEQPRRNRLVLSFDPDRIELTLNVNGAGQLFDLEPAELGTELGAQELPPYARLLRAVLAQDSTLSVRGDEAEESWRIVDPILDAWRSGVVDLEEYPAGSGGPPRVPLD